uniref:Uncharacterized protein n=1 Tax=Solanum tuberosum TaxID=4113 RepID=M1BYP8_SOLTU
MLARIPLLFSSHSPSASFSSPAAGRDEETTAAGAPLGPVALSSDNNNKQRPNSSKPAAAGGE